MDFEKNNIAINTDVFNNSAGQSDFDELLNNYKFILNSSSDIIFIIDSKLIIRNIWGNVFLNNPALKDIYLNHNCIEIFGETEGAIHNQANQKVLEGEKVIYEWKMLAENGDQINFQTSLTPISNEKNNIIGIVGIGRDITQLKISQSENLSSQLAINSVLKLNKAGYNLNLQDFIQLGIDECTEITNSQIGFFHFVNTDQETISLQTWSSGTKKICDVPEKSNHYPISEAGNWVEAFWQKKPIIDNDYRNSKNRKGLPEGHVELERMLVVPIIDDGLVVALFGVGNKPKDYIQSDIEKLSLLAETIWNIIKRKKVELIIHDSEQKYRSLVENAFDAIYLLNYKTLEFVNHAFCDLFGYSADELLNKNFDASKLFPDDVVPLIEERINARMMGKSVSNRFNTLIKKRNGDLLDIEINSSVIKVDEEIKILGIIRDISDRVKYEEKLIDAKNTAEENTRLKISLLSNISHELRTPLNGILGFCELMLEKTSDEDDIDMLNSINISAIRLKKTFDSLIDLSKVEFGNKKIHADDFDINQTIKILLYKYTLLAKDKGLNLSFIENPNIPILHTDERMLLAVIENLLDNAIKFTNHGNITINLFHNNEIDKSEAVVCIKDTGIGIPDNKLELIFDEFRQVSEGLNRNYEGIGLGLTIVKKYLNMMKGYVDVVSEEGKGSSFYVYLPLEKANKATRKNKDSINIKKILYVEDDKFARSLMNRIIDKNYILDIATNDVEAWEKVNSKIYDLILMDINLGVGKNGIELTNDIRQLPNYINVPIIALTAYAMLNERDSFLNQGFDNYLSKPFRKSDLYSIMNKYLNSGV